MRPTRPALKAADVGGLLFLGKNEHMIWAAPAWLWGLLLIPVVYFGLTMLLNRKNHTVLFPKSHVLRQRAWTWSAFGFLAVPSLRVLALLCLCLTLARPQAALELKTRTAKLLDIMMVLDLSNSMNAYDVQPTRLKAAKAVFSDFVQHRSQDRLGLVGFSGKSLTLMPMTTDHQALIETLQELNANVIAVDGTAMGDALLTAANRLLQVHPIGGAPVIILATDGINTQGIDPMQAAAVLAEKHIKCYTIGLGGNKPILRYVRTVNGQTVPMRDIYGHLQYWSKPDYAVLEAIAGKTGGQFFQAQNRSRFEAVLKEIDGLEKTVVEVKHSRQVRGLFLWPLGLGLALLIMERLLSRIRYLDFT